MLPPPPTGADEFGWHVVVISVDEFLKPQAHGLRIFAQRIVVSEDDAVCSKRRGRAKLVVRF